MSRTKLYLETEAKDLGIVLEGTESTSQIMDKLMEFKAPEGYIINQLEPMAAQDAKKFMDYTLQKPWATEEMKKRFWHNPEVIAELKLDGVRVKGHIKDGKIRFDSRARSDVTYVYNEITPNVPHFAQYNYNPEYEDTIIDGEFLMPVDSIDTSIVDGKGVITKGTLTTTMAVIGSGPSKAKILQDRYGNCTYKVFDILRYKGRWVVDLPWIERRAILGEVIRYLKNPYITLVTPVTMSDYVAEKLGQKSIHCNTTMDLMQDFEDVTNAGGEGLMFKNINGPYGIGKRSKEMWKLKKFETAEGFITGYLPGEAGFTGLVGCLLISAYLPDGKIFEFAGVSQITLELRKELTAPDGSLKAEYYDKVIEVKGQERTKTNRFRHAVLFRWRPDRSPDTCRYLDI